MQPELRNLEYYDEHYRAAHPLLFWLHGRLSFDQRSKTRPNLALLRPALKKLQRKAAGRPLRVLDYGSGFGTLLLGLPRRGFELFAYDISPRAVTQLAAAARWFGRHIERLDPNDPTWPAAELDVIVCSHVLEHVPSDDALVRSFARALRPHGLLLINVPIHELWDDPKHARRYQREGVQALLERHGFRVLETRELDRWTAWLCLREQIADQPTAARAALRGLRLVLGTAPAALVNRVEKHLLAELPPQQLLVLAELVRPSEGLGSERAAQP